VCGGCDELFSSLAFADGESIWSVLSAMSFSFGALVVDEESVVEVIEACKDIFALLVRYLQ